MNSADAATVESLLAIPQNIVIIPHKNPDGDAIGSCMGLAKFLEGLGQRPNVVAPNDYPKFLKWMPGNEHILNFEKENLFTSLFIG